MERYTIPFTYHFRSYYVFIGKHSGSKFFEITQLVPDTDEKIDRQIPVQAVRSFVETLSPELLNFQQTIIRSLAVYLQQKGWPIDEDSH